jgi:hypothetical protein
MRALLPSRIGIFAFPQDEYVELSNALSLLFATLTSQPLNLPQNRCIPLGGIASFPLLFFGASNLSKIKILNTIELNYIISSGVEAHEKK